MKTAAGRLFHLGLRAGLAGLIFGTGVGLYLRSHPHSAAYRIAFERAQYDGVLARGASCCDVADDYDTWVECRDEDGRMRAYVMDVRLRRRLRPAAPECLALGGRP